MGYASHSELQQRETAVGLRELERIVAELRAAVAEIGQQVLVGGSGGGVFGGNVSPDLVYALTGGGGLTAAAGTTLGSGSVTLYTKAGAALTITASTATCYSGSTAVVGSGGKLIGMILRADGTGAYDCVSEFC